MKDVACQNRPGQMDGQECTRVLATSSTALPWLSPTGVKVLFRVGLLLIRLALGSSEKLRGCPGLVETLEKLRSIPPQFLQEDSFMAEVETTKTSCLV